MLKNKRKGARFSDRMGQACDLSILLLDFRENLRRIKSAVLVEDRIVSDETLMWIEGKRGVVVFIDDIAVIFCFDVFHDSTFFDVIRCEPCVPLGE